MFSERAKFKNIMENKRKRKIYLISILRTGSIGYAENCVAYSENQGIIFLGDKAGVLHFILLRKYVVIKRLSFDAGISSLKFSESKRALLFLSGIHLMSWSFNGNKVNQKKLTFVPTIIELIKDEKMVAVAGNSHGIHFFNLNFQHTFTTYYKDYDTSFVGLNYFPSNHCLIACMQGGGIVAFDNKTQRIIQHDYSQPNIVNYLWCMDDGSILVSASKGTLYLRKFLPQSGFETKSFTWMKSNSLIGVVHLREDYIFALHEMEQEISVVRVRDWQITKHLKFFKNTTGGIALSKLGKQPMFTAIERGEGIAYIFKF